MSHPLPPQQPGHHVPPPGHGPGPAGFPPGMVGPPGMPPPPGMGPRPIPPKKKHTGLIVGIVAGVLAVCCLGGFGGWYAFLGGDEVVDEMTAGEPGYPQAYAAQVPPAAPANATYGAGTIGGGGLCQHADTLRIGYVLSVERTDDTTSDYGDSDGFECRVTLSNTDEYYDKGTTGEFSLRVQIFDEASRAAQDFETNSGLFSTTLPSDGLELPALVFDATDDQASRRTLVQVLDGNMLMTAEFEVQTAAVPVEVLRGVSVDTINEVFPLLTP
ncbi:hypothetical protein [Phytomonospora endophytica]|uniref:DUF4352 domain-containing protein n=1 Tax=Phytomonospora endophytica TaxID=714109 RepID=A0A841G2A7_9ACTN|nr:hypothetical protein [Phytomonospora endophytica]MBB6039902.1 hypothetical protein [Phytomonospora endophytica]GIG71028.1 hypothetical protein Pen01_73230 [Phytomonospora endophytica]